MVSKLKAADFSHYLVSRVFGKFLHFSRKRNPDIAYNMGSCLPDAFNISPIQAVVVVFPLVPVTAIMGALQYLYASSTSLITSGFPFGCLD
jgi:hypothetical protein